MVKWIIGELMMFGFVEVVFGGVGVMGIWGGMCVFFVGSGWCFRFC